MRTAKKLSAIHQALPNLSARDAIGNECLLMREWLRQEGYDSDIFVYEPSQVSSARPYTDLVKLPTQNSLLLYHFSIGSPLSSFLLRLRCRIWTRYHNITPAYFFDKSIDAMAYQMCALGRQQIKTIGFYSELVIGDSHYNSSEFDGHTKAPLVQMPIWRDYEVLKQLPDDQAVAVNLRSGGKKNLLFVGRVAPNKAQQDLVEMLHLYRKLFGDGLRLILVGGFFSLAYKQALQDYAKELGLKMGSDLSSLAELDVICPGSITDAEMATLYRYSDAFVSTSEHEGFGVPIVEAMFFGLPIVAHPAAAVPETLGQAGLLADKANAREFLTALQQCLYDEACRKQLATAMQQRRSELNLLTAQKRLAALIEQYI